MSQPQFDHTPYTEWYIPTLDEFEVVRQVSDLNKSEMAEILGYSERRSGYTTVLNQGNISVRRMKIGVDYFNDEGLIDWYMPEIKEIGAEVDRLDIAKKHISESLGYQSPSSFHVAIAKEGISYDKYRRCLLAIEFHQENGYLPLPWEIE